MILAIDPGIRGALAFCYDDSRVAVLDMPIRKKQGTGKVRNEINPTVLQQMVRNYLRPAEKTIVVMENLNTFAGGSVQSMGSLEATKAVICTVMELNGMEVLFVSPKAWQSFYGIKKNDREDTKTQSLRIARQLFGQGYCPLAKHDGRADALLIARWALRKIAEPEAIVDPLEV